MPDESLDATAGAPFVAVGWLILVIVVSFMGGCGKPDEFLKTFKK